MVDCWRYNPSVDVSLHGIRRGRRGIPCSQILDKAMHVMTRNSALKATSAIAMWQPEFKITHQAWISAHEEWEDQMQWAGRSHTCTVVNLLRYPTILESPEAYPQPSPHPGCAPAQSALTPWLSCRCSPLPKTQLVYTVVLCLSVCSFAQPMLDPHRLNSQNPLTKPQNPRTSDHKNNATTPQLSRLFQTLMKALKVSNVGCGMQGNRCTKGVEGRARERERKREGEKVREGSKATEHDLFESSPTSLTLTVIHSLLDLLIVAKVL